MVTVPLPRRFYGRMIEAFRTEKVEWKDSEDITAKYVKSAHDWIYYVGVSAISAITTWVTVSAANHITASGGQLWADCILWRAKQSNPPLEPPPAPPQGGLTLPGQLPLFGDPG